MDDEKNFEALPVVEKTVFDDVEFPDELGNKYAETPVSGKDMTNE